MTTNEMNQAIYELEVELERLTDLSRADKGASMFTPAEKLAVVEKLFANMQAQVWQEILDDLKQHYQAEQGRLFAP